MPTVVKAYLGSTPLFTTTTTTLTSYRSSDIYTRPSYWLTLPSAATDEVRGLHAVFDSTENYCVIFGRTNDASSWFVDWGDGSIDTVTSNTTVTHNYAFSATALDGTLTPKGYKQALVRVYANTGKSFYAFGLNYKATSPTGLPTYSSGWLDVNVNLPNLAAGANLGIGSNVIRHGYLEKVNITSWGSVNSISTLFWNCNALLSVNEHEWNMSGITSLGNTFFNATSISQLDCSSWNLSAVSAYGNAFRNMTSLRKMKLTLSNPPANTSCGTMFFGSGGLQDLDVSNWNTGNVTDMNYMFGSCGQLRTLNLSAWNTAKVTSVANMFDGCASLDAIDISTWNLSACTNATQTFNACANIQKLETCNLSAVNTAMTNFAAGCGQLKKVTLQGIGQTINFSNCQMSSSALNTLYTNLSTVGAKTITVTGNYGSAGSTTSIATAKGWTVVG